MDKFHPWYSVTVPEPAEAEAMQESIAVWQFESVGKMGQQPCRALGIVYVWH